MKKLCFSCFKRIPLFAGRCPYCLDQHQGMYGRILIGLFIIFMIFILIKIHDDNKLRVYNADELMYELKK